jgi:rhamnosyltransferase
MGLASSTRRVSVIIRTLNEENNLAELLDSVQSQKVFDFDVEVVVIDSGSTDRTLEIAENFNSRIATIEKSRFTFGRSLNEGCEFAFGDVFVFISGHCVPTDNNWLVNLVNPVLNKTVDYTYGRQLGRFPTKFSETELFKFPDKK